MKQILIILLFLPLLSCCQRDTIKPFELTYHMWNHAGSYKGAMLYKVTEDSVHVYNVGVWDNHKTLLYSALTPVKSAGYLSKIDIASLDHYYNNENVMITSGNEYFIKFKNAVYEKEVLMHMYYVKEVWDIVQELNKILPENIKAEYQNTNDF